jgi:hypothetical protein
VAEARFAQSYRFKVDSLTEDRLVLSEARAPQPDHDVHDGAHSPLQHIIVRSAEGVQEVSSRLVVSIGAIVKAVPRPSPSHVPFGTDGRWPFPDANGLRAALSTAGSD